MDIEVSIQQVADLEELAPLREHYFDGLRASQEVLLEVQIPAATGYRIVHTQSGVLGYALVRDATVLEFHLDPAHAVFGQTIFDQLLAQTGATRALVKSFDDLFFSSCVDRHQGLRSVGLLVRDYVRRPLPQPSDLRFTARVASLADLTRVAAVDQPVFTDPARLRFVIEGGFMQLFEHEAALLGFGIMRPVVPGRSGVDIAIALDRPHRNHGYAAYFLQHMAELCLSRGLTPIAGCAIENRAVRATGERIGMYAKHRLIELRF
jgi:GNAT superfamily N-acetyltransferase